MTELRTPSDIYLDALVAPYVNVMKNIYDTQTFYDWVIQIIPEDDYNFGEIENKLALDLQTQKDNFIKLLKDKLISSIDYHEGMGLKAADFTPWELGRFRDEETTRLFGPASIGPLPVIVILNNQPSEIPISEEFAAGLGIGLAGYIPLYMYGVPLDINHLSGKFSADNPYLDTPLYHTKINGTDYYFTSPDFVQGAITASNWLGLDAKKAITELYSINDDGTETLLDFN